jgi:DNA-binding MarR family transcriptional regulator
MKAERDRTKGRRQAEATEAAFRAFVRAWGLVRRVMEPVFRGSGISASQWGVLRALRRAEDEGLRDLRLTDLGDRLLVRPPSVTGVVGRLERMGLLERRASATDLRAKEVRLTAAGRRLLEQVREKHRARVRTVLEGLSPAEQGRWRALLERLAPHLERFDPDGANAAGPASGTKIGNSA